MEQLYTIVGIVFVIIGILAILIESGLLQKCSNCGSRLTYTTTSSSGRDASEGHLEHIHTKCRCFKCKVTETEHKKKVIGY